MTLFNVSSCCDGAVRARLSAFSSEAGFANAQRPVTLALLSWIAQTFPEALSMIADRKHDVYALGDVFPVWATPAPEEFVRVEAIDAPTSMTGARLRICCGTCGRTGHLVTVNTRMLTLMKQLLWCASNGAAVGTVEQARKALVALCADFGRHPFPYDSLTPPPDGPWGQLVMDGASWLLFHEIAHVVAKPTLQPQKLRGDFVRTDIAREELGADLCALRLLRHRRTAASPFHERKWLYGGVEFALLTLMVVDAASRGNVGFRRDSAVRRGAYHPTPFLRLSYVADQIDAERRLGTLEESYDPWRESLLRNWHDILDALVSIDFHIEGRP